MSKPKVGSPLTVVQGDMPVLAPADYGLQGSSVRIQGHDSFLSIGQPASTSISEMMQLMNLYTQIKIQAVKMLLDYLAKGWLEPEDVYSFFEELFEQPEDIASDKERAFAKKYLEIIKQRYEF